MTEKKDYDDKDGQQGPEIIHSNAPHVVVYNEKTGKAARPGHVNAAAEAVHGNAPSNLTASPQSSDNKIVSAEASSDQQVLVVHAATPTLRQVQLKQPDSGSAVQNIIAAEKKGEGETAAILFVDGKHQSAAQVLKKTLPEKSDPSKPTVSGLDEAQRHVLTPPLEVSSTISIPALDATKSESEAVFSSGAVTTGQFASTPAEPPFDEHIGIPAPSQPASARLISSPDSATAENIQRAHQDNSKTPGDNATTEHGSALKQSSHARESVDASDGQSVDLENFTLGAMRVSLSSQALEKLAKEERSSQELSEKLDALAKRMSDKKK